MTLAGASAFPVVGIGGSAGGLQPLENLFAALAPDCGAAFVVVQHLKPDQPSQLTQILARHSSMPVTTIENGMPLKPNHVYVAPPGWEVLIEDNRLRLTAHEAVHGMPTSIDRLFRSLAAERGAASVGVVLSGMGGDGSLGLKAIKAAGGVVLVQDPDEAQFDAMPRSAIATHLVDRVLKVDAIAEALQIFLSRHNGDTPDLNDGALEQVLELLRRDRRRDFRGYKRPMIQRRIVRRMQLAGLDRIDDYLLRLHDHGEELEQLQRDLLISVTDFFRDPDAHRVLQTEVLPGLVAGLGDDTPLRAWVPACATGEEAYTIAMQLSEAMSAGGHDGGIQVFASDIDERALEVARVGQYPVNIATDIPPEFLQRYFNKIDHSYQVSNDLRQNIVFAIQDLIRDPPYSKLHLISCRNLLIYLGPEAQQHVLSLFHFALRDDGYLFLGNAETVGQADDLFEAVDKRHRIYRRIAGAVREPRPISFDRRGLAQLSSARSAAPAPPRAQNFDQIAQQLLLREYVPATVLINRKAEILCAYGPTHRYLALPTGASRLDLMDMAADDLRSKLRGVTHQAIREHTRYQVTALRDGADGGHLAVRITVRPLARPVSARGLLLVTFEDEAVPEPRVADREQGDTAEHRMAEELRVTREELQNTIGSLEAANEDLQGSNEEIMSINEELQSTNEELETSKEELQSLNEELSTVNNELRYKVGELERANNDLANLFSGTRVATLFLDPQLRIMRFTPAIKDMFNLLSSDIGRPLQDINLKLADPVLLEDAALTLERLEEFDREVQAEDGHWYQRRVTPYRTLDNVIEGVVITFNNITELKQAVGQAQHNEQQLRLLANALPALIAYVDADLRFVFANAAYEEWFALDPESLCGRPLESWLREAHFETIAGHCEAAKAGSRVTFDDSFEHQRLGERQVHVSLVPFAADLGFYLLATDITDRKEKENTLLDRQAESAHANRIASMSELAATVAHQLNQPLGSISSYAGALKRLLAAEQNAEPLEIVNKLAVQTQAAGDILRELREFIGRRTFDLDEVDINAMVRRVLVLTEGRIARVGAEVKLSLAPNLPRIEGAPVQFEQLLVNLVVNALEAMEGAPTRLLGICTQSDGNALEVQVTDTGPGVSADTMGKMFNAFYTSKEDGMGMGLAISRGIAEDYGGKLWAESPEAGGASFRVRLPLDMP